MDLGNVFLRDLLQTVIVEDHLIRPCPTVVAVVVVDLHETVEQLLDVLDVAVLHVTHDAQFLTLRQQQSAKIRPATFAHETLRTPEEALLLGTLQHGTHIDTQRDIVILQSFAERRGIDHVFVEVIGRHVVARGIAQGLQHLDAFHDLTHGEGREPVEVDDTLLRQLRTLVTLRPLLDVAIETHSGNVTSRHQRHRLTIVDEIGERQVTGVGMVHQLAETDAERADGGRHQDIATRSRLRSTLEGSPVQRAHLIGMVREIRVRAGIIERELTTDEQRTLVVGSTEGSAERGTGLTVGHIGVGKEETGLRRETVGNLTGLTHKAVLHLHTVIDRTTVADDGILADDTRTDEYRCIR